MIINTSESKHTQPLITHAHTVEWIAGEERERNLREVRGRERITEREMGERDTKSSRD